MAQPDIQAEHDFSEETTLIFGATNGFGRKLAVDLRRRGVRRIGLGTTNISSDHYVNTLREVRASSPDLGAEGIMAVPANLMDQGDLGTALDKLPKAFRPKHVFMLPATGMQFALDLGKDVSRLQRIKNRPQQFTDPEAEKKRALLAYHQNLDIQLPRHLRESLLMNINAPVQTIEALINRFPEGFTFNYLSSIFSAEGRGERSYTDVLTKHFFSEIWLPQNAEHYARRGVDTSNIITGAILGTNVGDYLVDEVSEVEDEKIGDLMVKTAVKSTDIFGAYYQFMLMSREQRVGEGLPFRRYVYRDGEQTIVARFLPSEWQVDYNDCLL